MATTQQLLSADEQIRASVAALGAAISAVPEYTPPALARAVVVGAAGVVDDLARVDDAQPPHFHVVLHQLMPGPHENPAGFVADLHAVVGHQHVAPLQ